MALVPLHAGLLKSRQILRSCRCKLRTLECHRAHRSGDDQLHQGRSGGGL